MLAQFSNDKIEFGGLFNRLKRDVESYRKIINDFNNVDLNKAKFKNPDNTFNWSAIGSEIKDCDDTVIGYFKTLEDANGNIKNASASTQGFSQYLKETGKSFDFAALKATALNVALNAGIILAVTLAIKGLAVAWDNVNVTVLVYRKRVTEFYQLLFLCILVHVMNLKGCDYYTIKTYGFHL